MKTIASIALVVLLAGCSGGGLTAPPKSGADPTAQQRAPRYLGGPGTTSLTYQDTYAPVGQCSPGVLSLNNGYAPASSLSFPAGQGPPLVVSNCNFSTPQYVRVTLGTPAYGTPFIRQSAYTVTVDAPAAAQVTATWTALGPTLPGTPGLSGTVTYNIGPSATGPVVWKTNGFPYDLPGESDGQCSYDTTKPTYVVPQKSGNDVTFPLKRDTTAMYVYPSPPAKPGSSHCYRNQLNPVDPNTGTNYLLAIGSQYTFTFQTVVTFNGNYLFGTQVPSGGLAADIPAIVWQTHTYNEVAPPPDKGGPCDLLVIQNTRRASNSGFTQYDPVSGGGLPTWNFHTCDDVDAMKGADFAATSYNSPDTLHDGEVDNWQIDITAQIQGQSGGSVVVQRNGAVVYSGANHVCDDTSPKCFWNFGPYAFYWPNSEEPTGWNNAGITVKFNDMTLVKKTPGGGGELSKRRSTGV